MATQENTHTKFTLRFPYDPDAIVNLPHASYYIWRDEDGKTQFFWPVATYDNEMRALHDMQYEFEQKLMYGNEDKRHNTK